MSKIKPITFNLKKPNKNIKKKKQYCLVDCIDMNKYSYYI